MLDYGIYDVFDRNVEYSGGNFGYEVDTRKPVPVDVLFEVGKFLITFEDIDNQTWIEDLEEEEIERMKMEFRVLTDDSIEEELQNFRDYLNETYG